jgi:Phosphotransferase enzyme family
MNKRFIASDVMPSPIVDTYIEKLALALDLDEYVRISRVLSADHTFWRALLPPSDTSSGTVLVIESRLGALSWQLSKRFSRVVSWHASYEAAERTQQFLLTRGATNIDVVIATDIADLRIEPRSLSAIIVCSPGEDPTSQWSGFTRDSERTLLRSIKHLLADSGVLVLNDNNLWAYRNDFDRPRLTRLAGNSALPLLKALVAHYFPVQSLFVSRSSVTATQLPCPDYVSSDGVLKDSLLPKNKYTKFKNALINLSPSRLLWPSYLMLASDRKYIPAIEKILVAHQNEQRLAWTLKEIPIIKRIVPGNGGTTIIAVGPNAANENCDVIVRLPSNEQGRLLCETNSHALRTLSNTQWASNVPAFIASGKLGGEAYFIEEKCTGSEVEYGTTNLNNMFATAGEMIEKFHQSSTQHVVMTQRLFVTKISPLFDETKGFSDVALHPRLDRLHTTIRENFVGKRVSIGFVHGDFKLGNLLFDKDRRLTSIIDWDGFSEDGFQVFDYLTHLLYAISSQTNSSLVEAYLEYVLPWKLPAVHARTMGQKIELLAGDAEGFQLLRMVFWLSQLSLRFDRLLKVHPEAQQRFLVPVLDAFERLLVLETPRVASPLH